MRIPRAQLEAVSTPIAGGRGRTVEASDIGLSAGEWPDTLVIVEANDTITPFIRTVRLSHGDGWMYADMRNNSITVLND